MFGNVSIDEVMNLEVGKTITSNKNGKVSTIHKLNSRQVMCSVYQDIKILVMVMVVDVEFIHFCEKMTNDNDKKQGLAYFINMLKNDTCIHEDGISITSSNQQTGVRVLKAISYRNTSIIADNETLKLEADRLLMLLECDMESLLSIIETP